jgi:diadenosine tetraphosphate (Ap4A) HIT family hydrolase
VNPGYANAVEAPALLSARRTSERGFMQALSFQLHATLQEDTHILVDLPEIYILLHKNAFIPWVILVPKTTTETDFMNVSFEEQQQWLQISRKISGFIKQYFKIQKINFAAIGNVVSQLHLHIVGRQTTDCIWPQPVWGHLHQSKAYDAKEVSDISVALKSFMAHSVKG